MVFTNEKKFFFDPYGAQLPSMVKVALTVGNSKATYGLEFDFQTKLRSMIIVTFLNHD